jgi:hypothetical protein
MILTDEKVLEDNGMKVTFEMKVLSLDSQTVLLVHTQMSLKQRFFEASAHLQISITSCRQEFRIS